MFTTTIIPTNILPTLRSLDCLFDPSIIHKYLNGGCGALALSLHRLSQWPIYGISLISPDVTTPIPSHYVLKVPDSEFFIDITGSHSKNYHLQYWRDYFLNNNEVAEPFDIIIHTVDDVLCNSDYYDDIIDDLELLTDADHLASIIWRHIT